MPSEASRIAALKFKHQRAVAEQEDGFHHEENLLRQRLDQAHKDAVDSVRSQVATPLKHAGERPRMPSDEAHQRNRVEAIGKLKGRHEEQRKQLDEKHAAELKAAMAKPAASPEMGRPERDDPLYPFWDRMTHLQRKSWHEIKKKYADRRSALDDQQAGTRQKTSRYDHATIMAHAHNRDIDEHLRLHEQERRELVGLRAEVENEAARNRHQSERQADEHAALAAKHEHERRFGA
jgi:hypothetical protein